jgi:hypothetical protein
LKKQWILVPALMTVLIGGAVLVSRGADVRPGAAAWWTFDDVINGSVTDQASGIHDEIRGNFQLVGGVVGGAIRFDGFTTCVTRRAAAAPRLADTFTMEAWVALAAYPWNWCPVLSQEQDGLIGYSFGVGPQGEFGLRVSVRGEWQTCLSPVRLPLKQWAHIAATFRSESGITLFLDGKEVAVGAVPGKVTYAGRADLLIGMNPEKRKPSHIVGPGVGTIAGWYAFDGVMDDVRIFDRALSASELKEAHEAHAPLSPPDLPARTLPSGPSGQARFGAYYTKLAYDADWDSLWPVGPAADIVVQFEDSPVRVVFWRGTRYSPAWVMDNGQWIADQSVEAWDDTEGCYEHMEDPRCLYSHVRVLESNEARAVVHWRYAPVSSRDHFWRVDEKTGWGLWVDEYYTFYPDQLAARKVVWTTKFLGRESPSQIQETIPLCQPGQGAGDILHSEALTLLNLNGEGHTYSWPSEWNDPERHSKLLPASANIQVVNLKSKAKPFIIFEPGAAMHVYVGRVRAEISEFPAYNHWPISLLSSDGRFAVAMDRVSSFSISYTDPPRHEGPAATTWASWLYGATDGPLANLVTLGRSWAKAPRLAVRAGDFISEGYDMSQRAYVLSCKEAGRPSPLECEFAADQDSPVANIALVIKNWGEQNAAVTLDGQAVEGGRDLRIGHARTLEGTDLVVWIRKESTRPVKMNLAPR